MDGTIVLSHREAEQLRAAMRQMDLLLHSQEEDAALGHLVALLRHLRAFRSVVG